MERMKTLLDDFGVKYEMTDDSEESPGWDDMVDTVIVLQEVPTIAMFMFTRDGRFKEFSSF